MSNYKKSSGISGKWVKGSDIKSGSKCRLVSETSPQASQFFNKDGTSKNQDVAKIQFQGAPEPLNISINRASINGLVDAFGEDSRLWMNKTLTALTEKVLVGGKRQTALYLVPDGYELKEDANGYMIVVKEGEGFAEGSEFAEEPNPSDIPW